MAVPWSALRELASGGIPTNGDQWRVNFSRVDWTMDIVEGRYRKRIDPQTGKALPENNWVWSPTGRINMHMPEQWGYVQFSEKADGTDAVDFVQNSDEAIKWALWQLYFQQRQYYEAHQRYSGRLTDFTIPEVANDCNFEPQIFTTPHLFEFTATACERDGVWSIRQDGKIDFHPSKK